MTATKLTFSDSENYLMNGTEAFLCCKVFDFFPVNPEARSYEFKASNRRFKNSVKMQFKRLKDSNDSGEKLDFDFIDPTNGEEILILFGVIRAIAPFMPKSAEVGDVFSAYVSLEAVGNIPQ